METGERSIKNITAKLVKVMEDVSHVNKNGTNDYHKYKYATAADVLEKVNESLCKNKICTLSKAEIISLENVINAKGNQEHLATVQMNIQLIDTQSGEWVEITGLGSGQDSGDKAVMKAETASIKYAYMMTFNISTGDDPEADVKTDEFIAAPMQNQPISMVQPQQIAPPQAPVYQPASKQNVGKKAAASASCLDCGAGVTAKVKTFSESRFGRCLCMNCQKNYASA